MSPEGHDEVELPLEPTAFPPAKVYQKALFEVGSPLTSLFVDDIAKERARLKDAGVVFRSGTTAMGTAEIAVFEDTRGNLIEIAQA